MVMIQTKSKAKSKAKAAGDAMEIAPTGAVALRSLTLHNVLSFGAEAKVELGSLNVLIGPNGCGKSNLVDVVALLKVAADGELSDEFQGMGSEWVWKGAERDKNGRGKMKVNSFWIDREDTFVHSMSVLAGEGLDAFAIQRDEVILMQSEILPNLNIQRADHDVPPFISGEKGQDRRSLLNPAMPVYVPKEDKGFWKGMQNPLRGRLSNIAKDVQIYRNRQVGRVGALNPLRRPSQTDKPNDRIAETLDNFALVLNRVRLAREDDLVKALREIYNDARGVDVQIYPNQVNLLLKEKAGNIPAQRMSDGMLNWLFLLTVLLDPKPPALVCIEEPETGLHPDMLPTLAKMLIDASKRMQLIVTTHSGGIVDALTDTPEAIVVCGKTDGITTMRRLSKKDVEGRDEGLGLAWASGAIGGTRW